MSKVQGLYCESRINAGSKEFRGHTDFGLWTLDFGLLTGRWTLDGLPKLC